MPNTFTHREPPGSLLAVVLIITITMILLMIANDNRHKIKTKARSPEATAVALRNGELLTARYCLPSDSIVWVLCTNIY